MVKHSNKHIFFGLKIVEIYTYLYTKEHIDEIKETYNIHEHNMYSIY